MLSIITFVPLLGALLIAALPRTAVSTMRLVAMLAALASFIGSLGVLFNFDPTHAGYQFIEAAVWIPQHGIGYKVGVDGVSIWLLMLTTFLFPIVIAASAGAIHEREKEYYALMLLMETATLGVFLALDMFLFYVFWEFALVPMYFIIGIWGGARRVYASIKFFIYTMAGSALMLVAILFMGVTAGTFDLEQLAAQNSVWSANTLLFLAFAIAFIIKVPLFPFHSWLPDAHTEAPTPGSVILAAVLLKMGAYGLIRFNLSLFPEASRQLAPLMIALSVIGILYGAIVAFAQSDAKRLIAYSSVSHMGYIVLGIFSLNQLGVQGALLQMINHGLSTGGLFMMIGYLYERRHTREMARLGGIWAQMPLYGALMLIFVLSSAGLPALNGFVGEFVILQGAFQANPLWTAFAVLGMVLSAVYLLTFFQKIFLGESRDAANDTLTDINRSEVLAVAPLIVLCFVIGLYSLPFFNAMSASVNNLLAAVGVVMR
ncbi:MAG: NADH-quinone oxidoreductase subunit M [Anaerolineae bacterium]|nr:NADH-quinone oxidoreductase subunit M [Thermoflexales bacterium]MDW8407055.1 NADH-quinone oxidoreductase subunit M [Anaerolineae bacterium]